jgi:hypothetical protein
MSASDDPLTSKEHAGPGTPEDRDVPKPNVMKASFSEALDQRAIAREREAHASLQKAIMDAAGPLRLVGTPAAWWKILFKRWMAAQALRSDDPCPSLPEEADLPNVRAAEKALKSLWDWEQKTLARLPGSPQVESTATKPLNPTKKKILSLCRRKALPGTAIARKLELSYDHIRRVLGQLTKAKCLTNGPDGYRTVRAT